MFILPCLLCRPYFHITNGFCPSSEDKTAYRKTLSFFPSVPPNPPHLKNIIFAHVSKYHSPLLMAQSYQSDASANTAVPTTGKVHPPSRSAESIKNSHCHQQVVDKIQQNAITHLTLCHRSWTSALHRCCCKGPYILTTPGSCFLVPLNEASRG